MIIQFARKYELFCSKSATLFYNILYISNIKSAAPQGGAELAGGLLESPGAGPRSLWFSAGDFRRS